MEILKLLLELSHHFTKSLSFEFQSHSIKVKDLKINQIDPFNPIDSKGGVEIVNLLLRMSYNMPKVLWSKFQSYSIKIEDICQNEFMCVCVYVCVFVCMCVRKNCILRA